jgi:hypothetical protein
MKMHLRIDGQRGDFKKILLTPAPGTRFVSRYGHLAPTLTR